jgi:hypothetical protein
MRKRLQVQVIICLITGLVLCETRLIFSQPVPAGQKSSTTKKIEREPPVIDGYFDDEAWETVDWEGGFIQQEPFEGVAPAQPTWFKVLFDDNHIYVAIMAEDDEKDKIVRRVTRRDSFDGDWVAIAFDSYMDKRTAFSFGVSAAGVKNDMIITNDDQTDDSWDPVWYVKTAITEAGWNAEMKIPFTQIRFARQTDHSWGLQVTRFLYRIEELSAWQYIPRESSGWVSMFGRLYGISHISPKREIELIPYAVGSVETYQTDPDNPFAPGKGSSISGGLDGKIAITNNLTLNFTANPDFGQVEADPSEVNLTAFETFFREKRPFFIEGSNIYNFPVTRGEGNISRDNLFYSRRIGRKPRYFPATEPGQYADVPEFTRILGAFKMSGKTRNGWSVGIMDALTAKTNATIDNDGARRDVMLEPLTNFFNTRLQKDINGGNTRAGGMFTATNRNFGSESVDMIHASAYTGGLDFTHYWKNRSYFVSGNSVFSHISGSTASVTALQRAPQRYFQRPDATHIEVDSTKTTLSGSGGTISGGKIGGGHWRYEGSLTWRTPGLELNDMGYLRQADIIQQNARVGYKIWEPFSIFREINLGFDQAAGWDFSGTRNTFGLNTTFNTKFINYWSFSTSLSRYLPNNQKVELRGGPAFRFPGDWNHAVSAGSDERKKMSLRFFVFNNWGDISHSRFFNASIIFNYRPFEAVSLSVEPQYARQRRDLQYVQTLQYNGEPRYILATLNADIFSSDIRVNFSLTPDLSLQYWGQPYIFAGNYSGFKRVTEPMADQYADRFHVFSHEEISLNPVSAIYRVDENGDGSIDYTFSRPDFNFFEFRSNLVLRWEYIPGSTLFLVWSQGRTGRNPDGEFNLQDNLGALFNILPHHIFLIKFSYRISI